MATGSVTVVGDVESGIVGGGLNLDLYLAEGPRCIKLQCCFTVLLAFTPWLSFHLIDQPFLARALSRTWWKLSCRAGFSCIPCPTPLVVMIGSVGHRVAQGPV